VDSSTLYDGACEIVAEWQGHKKVLRLTDDATAAEDPFIYHNETQATAGTREFWIGSNDVNTPIFDLFFYEEITSIIFLMINANNLYYRDSVDAFQVVQAIADDTLYQVKVVWRADNTQDIWVDGVLKVDNVATNNNQTSGINRLRLRARGDTTSYLYLDAYGDPDNDANYEVGDNLEVDFHYYNKEEITAITQFPTISPRLDAYWMGGITVRDFEGALFADWYDRDFNKILIEDDSDNVLFRGFLIKKLFKNDEMSLSFAGIGILLDWNPFGSDGYVDYVVAEGLVKAPISSDSILQVKDDEGGNFTWDPDILIKKGKDLGLLIVDKTDVNTRTWDSSAISQSGGTVTAGNNASTTAYDGVYYNARDVSAANLDLIVTPVIDGIAIDDTDFLKSIQIEYSFRAKVDCGALGRNYGTVYFQILKDTSWITIDQISVDQIANTFTTSWKVALSSGVVGGCKPPYAIYDTDAELQKFFNKTDVTYTSLKGMRFKWVGGLEAPGYVEVHVDFINVKPGYASYDISPIMTTITGNAATSLTSADVSAWDETGVVVDDGFKIGVSTRKVIEDVASQSGLNIKRIDNYGETSYSSKIHPNGDSATIEWTTTGGDHFGELDDDSDLTYVDTSVDGEEDIYTFGDFNLRGGYVTGMSIYYRQKCDTINKETIKVSYSIDGGDNWSSTKSETLTANWVNEGAGWSSLEIYDLSDFQVKLLYTQLFAGSSAYVSELYISFTISGSSFDKYIAREFRGSYCSEPLSAVCKLEGSHWYEDYINNRIVVIKKADFVDSTVDLTEANYSPNWEYEDECNQVKSFYVFGNAEDAIFAKAVDESVEGYISKQLIDESIGSVGDAQEIADAQLALLKTKRPSIKITLNGINANLQLGTTVGLTMVRPTVAEADYPIRMIERSKFGGGIKTVIYCGLGESTMAEKIAKTIRDNAFRAHKALTDRLISP